MPVDEGAKDASFAAFRTGLLDIGRKRDAAAFMKIVNPKIRTSFGPGGGSGDFRKSWKPEDPQSPLWEEMEHILTHGGTFNKVSEQLQFWAPYVYSAWGDNGPDAFQFFAVIDENVPLRESKDASSKSIATLSYDIVKREEEQQPWTRVTTADNRTGWVESKHLRSPIGYRAGFTKRSGQWKMDALVSGG